MSDAIKLRCLGCGKRMNYARSIDPTIPPQVVRIESTSCDRCDNGDFGDETMYDAEGSIVPHPDDEDSW